MVSTTRWRRAPSRCRRGLASSRRSVATVRLRQLRPRRPRRDRTHPSRRLNSAPRSWPASAALTRPASGMADAFGRWLEEVLGERGLVVYDSPIRRRSRSSAMVSRASCRCPGRPSQLAALAGSDPHRARLSRAGACARRQPGAVSPEPGRRQPARDQAAGRTRSWSATIRMRAATLVTQATRTSGRVQPERAAAPDRPGHALPDDLLCRRPERASPISASCAASTHTSACRCRSSTRAPPRRFWIRPRSVF